MAAGLRPRVTAAWLLALRFLQGGFATSPLHRGRNYPPFPPNPQRQAAGS